MADVALKQHICATPLYMTTRLITPHNCNIAADTLYTRSGVAGTSHNANSPHLLVRNDSPLSKVHKEDVPR